MRLQDQLVRMTQRALDDVIRAVEAMPDDKKDWSPSPTSRSALNMMRELAVSTSMICDLIRHGKGIDMDSHGKATRGEMPQEGITFAQARDVTREGTAELSALIANFPDERLEDDIVLPFGGGIRMTMADCLALHYWNLTYHCGQVNYLQTMLGDMRMH